MLFTRELKPILPEAKFIHFIRDPRDIVASLKQQRWAPDSMSGAISYYKSLMDKIIKVSESLNEQDIFQIKLEDLVSAPTEKISALCAFCKIDPFVGPINKDLINSHSGRWTSDFNEKEKKILLRQTKKYRFHYSY